MIILQLFHVRFGQCLLKLQRQVFPTEQTPLRLISSILIRQKYYTTHFHFDNKLLIKQKSLIRKFIIFNFMTRRLLFK
jgi:hypothetical protein